MASKNETFSDVIDEFGKNIELMHKCKLVGVSLTMNGNEVERWRKALKGEK